MVPEEKYSNSDKQLLQDIDYSNKNRTALTSADPLAPHLLRYKEAQLSAFRAEIAESKKAAWEAVNRATQAGRKGSILQFVTSSTAVQKWAAAAVVVLAVVIGLFYTIALKDPVLLAEAMTSIETVTLADGSTVSLRPNSRLYSVSEKSNKQLLELSGEAFFDVTENKNRTFTVKTAEGAVSVLGTRFNLSSRNNELRVYLEEGSVKVESAADKDGLILKPGESAAVVKGGVPVHQNITEEEATGWLSQSLIFNNRALTDIIGELEQHFDVGIEVSAGLLQQSLTGELSLKNIDTTLADLGKVLGGTFEKTNNNIYKFNQNL